LTSATAAVTAAATAAVLSAAVLAAAPVQTANEALAREKERMDVLLARQHNLISCVLQGEADGGPDGKHGSSQNRTLGGCADRSRLGTAASLQDRTQAGMQHDVAHELAMNEQLQLPLLAYVCVTRHACRHKR
jgi:hypothetical protein